MFNRIENVVLTFPFYQKLTHLQYCTPRTKIFAHAYALHIIKIEIHTGNKIT